VLTDTRVRLLLGPSVAAARPRLGCRTVDEVRERGGAPAGEVEVSPEALGLIQFSSGSTVDPKPVALSHRVLMAQLAALQRETPVPEGAPRVGVSWLPLYHDMGLVGCLLLAAYHPGSLVLIPPELFLARPALWLRALSRHRGIFSTAPNFAYGLCLKRVKDAELEGVDLSGWTQALNGAEPVSVETLRRFSERFARWGFRASACRPVYGMSETALAVTFPPHGRGVRSVSADAGVLAREGRIVAPAHAAPSPEGAVHAAPAPEGAAKGARVFASVGRPLAGFEVEVRGPGGEPLPERQVGRIHVRGPSVMTGYFGLPEATVRALSADGWLDTGDLGFAEGGELFITGRAKDLVIVRGANHAPQAFEDPLEGVEGVRTGCAVALGFLPEGEEDEALLLLAERAGAAEAADDATVEEHIRAAVLAATGIRPHTVRLLEPGTLPRTSSGKLRRQEALRRYLAGELHPPRRMGAVGMAVEVARSALAFARAREG
ncbi:MAG TPA: AMP-binding protein, partial [Aggregicoccus sp.]|nr:AMP-binding protein [Aggregicoccus sp.]